MPGDVRAFAAAVAHDLRTPLSAICGEVDLALRRERTASSYRDTLARISASLTELVDFTADLAVLGQGFTCGAPVAHLRAVLASLAARHAGPAAAALVAFPPNGCDQLVAGDPAPLEHALALVLDHVVQHNRGSDPVTLEACAAQHRDASGQTVTLVIAAGPGVVVPGGSLRLRAAALILQQCNGRLDLADVSVGRVEVHLQSLPRDPCGSPSDAR
jgi:signal transduction histidine kinase